MNALQHHTRILTLTLVLALMGSTHAIAGGKGITGLWQIQGTPAGAPEPAFTNLAQIGKGGSLTNLDPWFGTGLGQWQRLGGGQYAISFTHYFLDTSGVGEVNVTGTAQLSANKLVFEGEFVTEISIGGFVVDSIVGTVEGTRQ